MDKDINRIKVMYQRLSANYGDLSKNSRTAGCGTDRTGKNKKNSIETSLFLS